MEFLQNILGFMLLVAIFVWPGYSAFSRKRQVGSLLDKTYVYLAAEYSFAPDRWSELSLTNSRGGPVKVPWGVTWAGAIRPVLDALSSVVSIWFGLWFLSALLLVGLGNKLFGQLAVDLFLSLSVGIVLLAWFLFCYRSVGSELFELEGKSFIASELLADSDLKDVDLSVIDVLREEIKADFEWYRRDTGVGGLLLLLLSVGVLYLGKESNVIPSFVTFGVFLLVSSITVSKWLHESYRSKVLRIALGSLSELKKARLLMPPSGANNQLQPTRGSGAAASSVV